MTTGVVASSGRAAGVRTVTRARPEGPAGGLGLTGLLLAVVGLAAGLAIGVVARDGGSLEVSSKAAWSD